MECISAECTARARWLDYLFLTREMKKAIKRQDLGLFEELIMQRAALQKIIDGFTEQEQAFVMSCEGREQLKLISAENEEVRSILQQHKNAADKQVSVARSYEGVSETYVGNRMDQQR
jgi:hypothetical protein